MNLRCFTLIAVCCLPLIVSGCFLTESKKSINELQSDGMSQMKNRQYYDAIKTYQDILNEDPTNGPANLMLAFGDLYLMQNDPAVQDAYTILHSDPQVGSVIDLYSELLDTSSESLPFQTQSVTRFKSSEYIQVTTHNTLVNSNINTIETYLLPTLDRIAKRLEVVLQNPDFSMQIDPALWISVPTGDMSVHPIDNRDVYVLKAITHGLYFILSNYVMYDKTLVANGDTTFMNPLLTNNPGYGVLRLSSSQIVERAQHIRAFATTLKDACLFSKTQFLAGKNESSQFMKKETWTLSDIEKHLTYFTTLTNQLNGTPVTIQLSPTLNLQMNLANWIDSPVSDIRDLNGISENTIGTPNTYVLVNNSTFDYTFHGLFPTMTTYAAWTPYLQPLFENVKDSKKNGFKNIMQLFGIEL